MAALDEQLMGWAMMPLPTRPPAKPKKPAAPARKPGSTSKKPRPPGAAGTRDRSLHQSINQQEEHLKELTAEIAEAQKTYQQVQAGLPDLPSLEKEYYELQEKVNALMQFLAQRRNDVLVLEDLKKQREKLKGEKEALTGQLAQLKLLERAFGKDGIPALLIEQALPEIESDANEILDRFLMATCR